MLKFKNHIYGHLFIIKFLLTLIIYIPKLSSMLPLQCV